MVGNKEIDLYHATDSETLEEIKNGAALYGWFNPERPSAGRNLVDDFRVADIFTVYRPHRRRGEDVVLIFRLNYSEVKLLGRVPGHGGNAYATIFQVQVEDLPDRYLEKAEISRIQAENMSQRGIIFYRVPSNTLIDYF